MPGQSTLALQPLVRPLDAGVVQETPSIAFARTFNGGQQVEAAKFVDRFAGQLHWMSGGKNREGLFQMSLRHAAHRIAGDDPRKAEKSVYAFTRQLLHCGLVDLADEAMLFGAKHALGESAGQPLDLSDAMLRELVFARLVAAGLAVKTDTSMLPPEWGLGKRWLLIKQPLDLGQFDEESRKYVGIDLLQRKIDPSRPDVEILEEPPIPYRRDEVQIKEYHDHWLSVLNTLEQAGIPVVRPAHELSYNVSVRSWLTGARKSNLHFPLFGFDEGQVKAVKRQFREVLKQGREAGVWRSLADWQIARNLVYQLSGLDDGQEPRWIAIES